MNLQNTLEYIASVAQNHPLINSSYVGSIYDLNSNTNTKYAVFAIEDIDVTKQNNTLLYNCYLYVVDRVMNDESNTIAVQTMAVNTLQEIINYIEGYSQSLEVYGSYIITPIRQKFSDECAGAYVQLRLMSQNDIGECTFSDDKVVEIFQGKTYLLDNYFTKSETLTLLEGKQDTISAGDGIDITNNVVGVDNTVAKKTEVYTKDETDSLLNNKQNTLTAGENINIENDVISVPRTVTLNNVQSPSDNNVLDIGSNAEQTKDYVYLTAYGNDSEAQISMEGSGNDNQASLIEINAYGYSDANVLLYGGGETRRSQVGINASGYYEGSISITGGTENEKKSEIFITAGGSESSEIQIVGGDENNLSHINIDSQRFTYHDNDVAVKPINDTFVSGNTIILNDNYIYSGSSITSLTINGTNFTGDCLVQFTTGAATPSITISGLVFDVLPTFNSNKYYEIGIHNGHCLWVEYDS